MELTSQQISFIQKHWAIESHVRFHRRLANFVYFANLEGREVILRLTETSHRKAYEIESELHWINYLFENGMQVANPIRSMGGSLFAELTAEKTFYVTVFEKAPGGPLKNEEDVPEEMIKIWGRYLGKMHQLTKNYRPPVNIQPRQQWEQDESLAMALRGHDKSDGIPYTRLNELLEWMRLLPKEKEHYGLIHTDLHRGNFFVDDNRITAFDFDDSCYQWFSYDFIAAVNSIHKNFYEGNKHPDKDKTYKIFLSGYQLENNLDQIWIDRIEIFDKFRAVMVYHWIKTFTKEGVFDAKNLEWAKKKAPQLMEILQPPLKLF